MFEDTSAENPLKLREDKQGGVQIMNQTHYAVQHEWDCLNLLRIGERNRVTKQTQMNQRSSRSHTIFQIIAKSTQPDRYGMLRSSKFNLCDLAGSEKTNKDEDQESGHVAELKKINLSLTTLGKVISALAKGARSTQLHVPFRESSLTRLLQDSFGGGTKTTLVATISPAATSLEETASTIKFADQARNVLQRVQRNESFAADPQPEMKLQQIQQDLGQLREILHIRDEIGSDNSKVIDSVKHLQQENQQLKEMVRGSNQLPPQNEGRNWS